MLSMCRCDCSLMKKNKIQGNSKRTIQLQIVTGLWSSDERAQEYAVTGAGLLAGSSILLLTLLWGVCFLVARAKFYVEPGSNERQLLAGSGVLTDAETRYHACVMLFSLIPLVVILSPSVFGLPYTSQAYKIVLLVSLCVSVVCLSSYFIYQKYDERIQNRRLEYAEVEQKVEMNVPFYDLQALMVESEKNRINKQKEIERELKNIKPNNDNPETVKELHSKYKARLEDMARFLDDPYSFYKSGTEYNQVAELLLEERHRFIKQISLMMERALAKTPLNKDGAQHELDDIDKFFNSIDENPDGVITPTELKKFIMKVNYDELLVDDEITGIIIRHLDTNGDGNINREEFRSGIKRLRTSFEESKKSQDKSTTNDRRGEAKAKFEERLKAILLLVVGIVILIVLAEPLVESVRKFSKSVNLQPFYMSFILVPVATNARTAIAAIGAAKQRRHLTTSYTFSEIYHKVFMNNILGFSVLVSVIYFRGLTWHFSAEILVLVTVCTIMGLLASLKSKFPDWTLLIALPLYPLSLVVVYFVNDAF